MFSTYAIVDDLIATGGTIECVTNLVRKSGKQVCGLVTVAELVKLKGGIGLIFLSKLWFVYRKIYNLN